MIADRIVIENNEIVFRLDIETAGANAAEIAVRARDEAVQAANRAEDAMVGKLDSDKNPALLKFNYIGGSETNDPVLSPSVDGWDQVFREIGNTITLEDGRRIMVYTGYVGPYELSYVGIAVSENYGPFVKEGPNGDGQLLFAPSEDPYLVEKDGQFYLYVEKKESGSTHLDIQLFTAGSIEDLLIGNVVDHGVILERGDSESWESQDVSSPTVILNDGTFYMLYEGRASASNLGAAGLAVSQDGINFIKNPSNPVASGTQINGDIKWASHLVPDDILFQNGLFYMAVHAYNSVTFAGGVLVSSDLVSWKDYLGTWVTREDGSDNFGSGLMLHYESRFQQFVAHYLSDTGIMKGYLTVSAKSTQSAQGPFVEKDGNIGLGTNDPQRKFEIYGPKNESIIRLGSSNNDSNWQYGDIVGGIEFYTSDESGGGKGITGAVKCITDGASGGFNELVFSLRSNESPPNVHDRAKINRQGHFVPATDGILNLGVTTNRWNTIYATTGTINTSDRKEKTEIESISETERQVALAIKQKIKKFKFKDAVQQKGTDARIHFGVIAQEVEEVFVQHGLEPRRYGLFCEDFWYTKTISVDEKLIEVKAEKGDPDAVEHVRLGIRYDELLAFIIAAL